MVSKTVTQLGPGNCLRLPCFPVQYSYGESANLDIDDMQDFIRPRANLHARQIAGFMGTAQCAGISRTDLAYALIIAVMDIDLRVGRFVLAHHLIDPTQAVVCIPVQCLSSLQHVEIAAGVIGSINFTVLWRFDAIAPRQASVAQGCNGRSLGSTCAVSLVMQDLQVATGVVVERLDIVLQLARVRWRNECR
ncbi:hypothetical protein D3C76_840580 [compost metagenome]